jgi:hypothetical protein
MVPFYKADMKFRDVHPAKMKNVTDFIEDHKKFPEHRVIVRFDVESPEKATLSIPVNYKVTKVSLRDVLIEADRAFPVGEVNSCQLSFGDNNTIRFVGQVTTCVRASRDDLGQQHDVGIEYVDLSDRSLTMPKDLISRR